MPAGYVCDCGALTRHPSGSCDTCREKQAARRSARRAVYDDPRWHACRRFVMRRDRWTCQKCGRRDPQNTERSLDAHHRRPVLDLVKVGLEFDPSWCETLCKSCHARG